MLFVFSNEKCLVFVSLFFGDEESESNWNAAAICWQKIDNSGAINKQQTFMMWCYGNGWLWDDNESIDDDGW